MHRVLTNNQLKLLQTIKEHISAKRDKETTITEILNACKNNMVINAIINQMEFIDIKKEELEKMQQVNIKDAVDGKIVEILPPASASEQKERMPTVKIHYNSKCLSCGTVKAEMLRIGPMVFCNECAYNEFKAKEGDEVKMIDNVEIYRKWMEKYYEQN